MESKLKVSAYCRVSTDKADQQNSLTAQIKYFTQYISGNPNWQMGEIYCDEGISGTSVKKRAAFNRMISDASLGNIDLILTKEVSRFARNTVDTLHYTRRLKQMGTGVLFVNDNIDTRDSDGELRLSIMASIAQEESRKTSERVKWGQKRSMEQGVVFGRDLMGYFVKNGELIINPDEAAIVKLIFHKFLNEEKGTHIIAKELEREGIRPKRANLWSSTAVLRILKNEKYVGDLCQKKTYTSDYLSHVRKHNNNYADMVYLKNHHEPIIERQLWGRAQDELKRRSPANKESSKHSSRYWCSGKIICAKCGSPFVSRTKALKNGSIYRAWRCSNSAKSGAEKIDISGNSLGCNSASINCKVLSYCISYIINLIEKNKDALVSELMEEISSALSGINNIDTLKLYSQIESLNAKKTKAINLFLDNIISSEDLERTNIHFNEEIKNHKAQITAAENTNKIHDKQGDNSLYSREIRQILDTGTESGLLYGQIVDKIIACDKNAVIVYLKHIPYGIRLYYQAWGKMSNYTVKINKQDLLTGKDKTIMD